MSLFEALVQEVRERLAPAASPLALQDSGPLPEARARSGLILQSEAACELGAPQKGSALAALYSNAKTADAAFLAGRPLSEIAGQSVDFALVLIASGQSLDAETFYQLTVRLPRLADHPGWMVKIDKTRIWVRVGREGAQKALEKAAATLTARIHAAFEAVEGVELYFVVDDAALVKELEPAAQKAQALLREVKTGVWKERGFDYESCELTGHCGACADKKTCASVRKIQARVNVYRKQRQTQEQHV